MNFINNQHEDMPPGAAQSTPQPMVEKSIADALAAELAAARAEVERLRKLVDRLPKSKDGVPVIADGMTLYCPKGHANKLTPADSRVYCTQGDCWDDGCQGDSGSGSVWDYTQCSSLTGELSSPPAPASEFA